MVAGTYTDTALALDALSVDQLTY